MTADLEVSLPTATSEVQIDASRFAAISRLADDLAHEFKNPLHAMVINLEVLKRRVEKGATEAALERTGVLEHEVQRLNVLLEALFRLLRPERRSEGPASVGQVLEEVRPILELRARIARVEYNQDVAPAEVYTSVKPDLLRFSLIVIADVLLEAARVNGGDLLLTTAALDEEIQLRIKSTKGADWAVRELAEKPKSAATLHGLPAAAALLYTTGGSMELERKAEPGVSVLIRIPRSSFV